MNNKSCALFRAANICLLDYPFEAALSSALSICDEGVIVTSDSKDDTFDWLIHLQSSHGWKRVHIAYQKFIYDRGWQERWWNFATTLTTADWLFYVDADECIHEDDAPAIRALLSDPAIGLIRFDLCNFYATADYVHTTPLRQARLGRRSRGWRMENWCNDNHPDWPACQMVYGPDSLEAHSSYQGNDIADGFPLYHYGHCRDAQALAISTAKHHAWYADGDGLENGRIPDVPPTDFDLPGLLADGFIRPYGGTHPAVIKGWLSGHAQAWQELERELWQKEKQRA